MKLKQLTKKEKPVESAVSNEPIPPSPLALESKPKPKKFERKPVRKISIDSDSSDDMPTSAPEPASQGESVFLKSLVALRDNVLTPANEDAVHQAGRLLDAMGINNDSDSDIGTVTPYYYAAITI